jgi:hypothetical protein
MHARGALDALITATAEDDEGQLFLESLRAGSLNAALSAILHNLDEAQEALDSRPSEPATQRATVVKLRQTA